MNTTLRGSKRGLCLVVWKQSGEASARERKSVSILKKKKERYLGIRVRREEIRRGTKGEKGGGGRREPIVSIAVGQKKSYWERENPRRDCQIWLLWVRKGRLRDLGGTARCLLGNGLQKNWTHGRPGKGRRVKPAAIYSEEQAGRTNRKTHLSPLNKRTEDAAARTPSLGAKEKGG